MFRGLDEQSELRDAQLQQWAIVMEARGPSDGPEESSRSIGPPSPIVSHLFSLRLPLWGLSIVKWCSFVMGNRFLLALSCVLMLNDLL